jgi:hypothetical protein
MKRGGRKRVDREIDYARQEKTKNKKECYTAVPISNPHRKKEKN